MQVKGKKKKKKKWFRGGKNWQKKEGEGEKEGGRNGGWRGPGEDRPATKNAKGPLAYGRTRRENNVGKARQELNHLRTTTTEEKKNKKYQKKKNNGKGK